MPLPELGGSLGGKRAAHLLRRATFGPTVQQIKDFSLMTPRQAIGSLFPASLPNPPLPIDPKTGTEWVTTGGTGGSSDDEREKYLLSWFVAQALNPSLAYSAREKIVFFLHSHFTTILSKVASNRAIYFQNQLFRLFALDKTGGVKINFRELTKKICVDNAMLRVLDGNLNEKGNPNENYSRELLELYSIGRGLEGSIPPATQPGDYFYYKELDVQQGARVLSGWTDDEDFLTIDTDTNLPRGKVKGSATNASSHDNDDVKRPKTFSEHFGSYTITPLSATATEASALDEISQWVNQIYAQAETAKNICRKLYRFFVYREITDAIDSTIIATLASDFAAGGFKLQPIIENILCSQHFYDNAAGVTDDNFGGIIKSPLDLAVGTLRFFEFQLPDMASSPTDFYAKAGFIVDAINEMGMSYFEPPDVSGYDAYHQWPIYNRSWITPNNLANRYKFIESLINANAMDMININVYDWLKNKSTLTSAADARNLIKDLVLYLFPMPDNLAYDDASDDTADLTFKRMNYFKLQLLQSFTETYWTNTLWPSNNAAELRLQLNYLFNAMLQSPEYQLF